MGRREASGDRLSYRPSVAPKNAPRASHHISTSSKLRNRTPLPPACLPPIDATNQSFTQLLSINKWEIKRCPSQIRALLPIPRSKLRPLLRRRFLRRLPASPRGPARRRRRRPRPSILQDFVDARRAVGPTIVAAPNTNARNIPTTTRLFVEVAHSSGPSHTASMRTTVEVAATGQVVLVIDAPSVAGVPRVWAPGGALIMTTMFVVDAAILTNP